MMTIPSDLERITALLKARHAAVFIHTYEEEDAQQLVRAATDDLGRNLFVWTAVRGVFDATFTDAKAVKDTENAAAGLYYLARHTHSDTICCVIDPVGHLIQDPGALRACRELMHRMREVGSTVVLIDHHAQPPEVLRAQSTPFELSLPGEVEIERIIRRTIQSLHREKEIKVSLRKSHFQTIVRNLRGLTRRQCVQIITDAVAVDGVFDEEDINHILAQKRRMLHRDGLLEYIEAPTDLSDIGGLFHLKGWLDRRRGAFDDRAREFGLTPPRGVLMLGVQGAGKSLCAKAIATAWQRPLLRLDPGTLYDRYVGESEKRLRDALATAEMMSPVVLWIDEIEKGFASAASHSTDGGLSKRMFGSLLTWMQEHEAPVFLVATANDIEALPPELLRKGRFDEIFFVDLPDREVRAKIFEIHLRKRHRDPAQFDLEALADVSEGYSGAEIEQAVISALHESFSDEKDLATAMLVEAVRNSPPLSVTMSERIAKLRQWSRGRCVPAG